MKAVSEYPTSAAIRCISSSDGKTRPIQTPAGLPPAGSVVNAADRIRTGRSRGTGASAIAGRSDKRDDLATEPLDTLDDLLRVGRVEVQRDVLDTDRGPCADLLGDGIGVPTHRVAAGHRLAELDSDAARQGGRRATCGSGCLGDDRDTRRERLRRGRARVIAVTDAASSAQSRLGATAHDDRQ